MSEQNQNSSRCPVCNDVELVPTDDPMVWRLCPACWERKDREWLAKRIAEGATDEELLGLKPAGMSIVRPGSDHLGRPVYEGQQS